LHLHTPASHDYEQPDKTTLDILKQAEKRGLSMIAFTDHNTVNGYRNMLREIEQLEMLERTDRIRPDELGRLNEYRRLLKKIVVLPGFEFTATFGFHILGLFPPGKPLRDLEYVLMQLRVPGDVLDKGLTEAGATSDVLTAYRLIDEAGGLAIAAHANSSNGVSMRGLNLGGQTRIAFTQDPHLHAIEFTDLDHGRRSSAQLFKGTRAEYPRVMHILQGSDAHRLTVSPKNPKRLGVGERTTELQLEDVSFEALRKLLLSDDFSHERPVFNLVDAPAETDDAYAARAAGASATIAFHPALPKRGDRFEAILRDVCAMANGEGGTIYIGCDAGLRKKFAGIADAGTVAAELSQAIQSRLAPQLKVSIDVQDVDGAPVIRVRAPRGQDAPYAIDPNQFFVRDGTETRPAKRDEILALARRGYEAAHAQPPAQAPARHEPRHQPQGQPHQRQPSQPREQQRPQQHQPRGQQPGQAREQRPHEQQRQPQHTHKHPPAQHAPRPAPDRAKREQEQPAQQTSAVVTEPAARPLPVEQLPVPETHDALQASKAIGALPSPAEVTISGAPRTGVQVLAMEERNGVQYFTVRDLRNNSTIRNVTRKSARDLWQYAITQHAGHPDGPEHIGWRGNRAVLARSMRAGKMRSDLAIRDDEDRVHVFYGATDDGLDSEWKRLVEEHARDDVTIGNGEATDEKAGAMMAGAEENATSVDPQPFAE
jgi:hypothetical protein